MCDAFLPFRHLRNRNAEVARRGKAGERRICQSRCGLLTDSCHPAPSPRRPARRAAEATGRALRPAQPETRGHSSNLPPPPQRPGCTEPAALPGQAPAARLPRRRCWPPNPRPPGPLGRGAPRRPQPPGPHWRCPAASQETAAGGGRRPRARTAPRPPPEEGGSVPPRGTPRGGAAPGRGSSGRKGPPPSPLSLREPGPGRAGRAVGPFPQPRPRRRRAAAGGGGGARRRRARAGGGRHRARGGGEGCGGWGCRSRRPQRP